MRVALITAPNLIGGLESSVAELAIGLAAAGVNVTLVQLLSPDSPGAAAFAPLATKGISVKTLRHQRRDYLGEIRAVAHLVRDLRVGVVHSHGERADLIVRLAVPRGPKKVSTVHGFVTNDRRARIVKQVHLRILAGFDDVIGVSRPLTDELAATLGRQRTHVIPNAISDTTPRGREDARAALGLSGCRGPVIGWVGRFSEEKSPETFLRAFHALGESDATAVMIGDGPELESCRRLVHVLNLGERCVLAGAVPAAGSLFPAFDLFVLSSRTEGTPITVLEAMKAGTAVVSSAVGGVPDLLAPDAGWLVPADDVDALHRAMLVALDDPLERARRAARAHERFLDAYSVSRWIDHHLTLYQAPRTR